MITKEALDRLIEISPELTPQTTEAGGDPFVIVPSLMKVESLAHLTPPKRIKQAPVFLECGSFIDYVNRFKTADTLIFANVSETAATFTAVLDYHAAAPKLSPAHCAHTASYSTVETPEWKTWLTANRQAMDQVGFATWLEDNAKLVVKPEGAALLELVRALHGHKNARFNSAVRLDNGAYSVAYEEDISVKATNATRSAEMELPTTIMAGIAPFQGAPLYEVHARLKTRVNDRKLFLWFETIALHVVVRDSVLLLVKQVAEKTKIVPLLGKV